MASLTQGTWVWVDSGSWWWTGRPCMLRFMGSQRVGHGWATELNWCRAEPLLYDSWDDLFFVPTPVWSSVQMLVSFFLRGNFYTVWKEILPVGPYIILCPLFSLNFTLCRVTQVRQVWCGDPGPINIIYCDVSAETGAIRLEWERSNWSLWFPLSSKLSISALLMLEESVIGLTVLVGSTNFHHMHVLGFVIRGVHQGVVGGIEGRALWAEINKN